MKFYVDNDSGTAIGGWIAPDNPSEVPSIRVCIPDRDDVVVEANVVRGDIRDLGMHNTGRVGFHIDETVIPDLSGVDEVEIREHLTSTLIYKRFKISYNVERRLMFYDMSVFPQRKIVGRLRSLFATNYDRVEMFPFDTLSTIIGSQYLISNVCFGRPCYQRYSSFLHDAQYVLAALLRDPYFELAERLLFINLLTRQEAPAGLAVFGQGYEPLFDFAAALPMKDERAMRAAIRGMSVEQRKLLGNPYTRTFGCAIDEEPDYRAVGTALEALARFHVVGIRDRYGDFVRLLNGAIGHDALDETSGLEQFGAVADLAARLSRVPAVGQLLEHDLALYSYVEEAVNSGLDAA